MLKSAIKIKSKRFSTTKRVVKRTQTAEGWKREMLKNRVESAKSKKKRSK